MGFLMVKQNNSSFEIKLQLLPLMMISSLGMIIVIYISVLMADIITDEYRNGTLKLSLIRPITRFELLISKVAGLMFGILILEAIILILSYVLGIIFFGSEIFKNIGSDGLISLFLDIFKNLFYTLYIYLLASLPYFAFGMIVFFISILCTNMGATIASSLGIWFVFKFLSSQSEPIKPFIISSYNNFYIYLTNELNLQKTIISLCVILAYILIFFISSVHIFNKKEILM